MTGSPATVAMPPSAARLFAGVGERCAGVAERSPTVLVAPSGFKECLPPRAVADAIADGVGRAMPSARIIRLPLADGGEGFVDELVRFGGGAIERIVVDGPVGDPVEVRLGLIGAGGQRTAVLEIADAAGLWRVPPGRRDPTRTDSRGVGQMIHAALDRGIRRIVIGCGDSGVNDGGLGMARALGVAFRDRGGAPVASAGALADLAAIDLSGRDPRLAAASIEVVVNPCARLLGPDGVSRRYGPQKGATPAQVERLEAGLARLAACIRRATGCDVAQRRGAGASGGLGAGFTAFCGARLVSRFAFVRRHFGFDAALRAADLVITAEGCVDLQTVAGKMPGWVARQARRHGVPVIALAGRIDLPPALRDACGFDALVEIAPPACSPAESIAQAARWLRERSAEVIGGIVVAGTRGRNRSGGAAPLPGRRRDPGWRADVVCSSGPCGPGSIAVCPP
ncbi:MAG: glycerate kinase [Lautropia sp.]